MLVQLNKKEHKAEVEGAMYITMSSIIYSELRAYVDHYKDEVSGCGLVEKIVHTYRDAGDRVTEVEYRITEVFLPDKQDNTGSTTKIEEETVHELMNTLLTAGKDTNKLRMHWHSHADMSTFHSTTDDENYNTLANNGFVISLVLNHDGDILGRVDVYDDVRISVSGLSVYVDVNMPEGNSRKIKSNIEKLDKHLDSKKTTGWLADWRKEQEEKDKEEKDKKRKKNKRGAIDIDLVTIEEDEYIKECMEEVKKCMKLSDEKADEYQNCSRYELCGVCKDRCECDSYNYALGEYGVGRWGYGDV